MRTIREVYRGLVGAKAQHPHNPYFMSDDEIEVDALLWAARRLVVVTIAILIGFALIPLVMPSAAPEPIIRLHKPQMPDVSGQIQRSVDKALSGKP